MAAQLDENIQYTDPATGELISNGYIYIGIDGLDAKLNPATIYSDRELTTILANPQRTGSDGRALNKIWIDGKYSMKVENYENIQKLNDLSLGQSRQIGVTELTNVLGTDNIVANAVPIISTLEDKQTYVFTSVNANTGAMTLKIDSTAAYAIKKYHDSDMQSGDIEAHHIVSVVWNATDSVFELVSSVAIPAFIQTLLDDTTAAAARTTLDAASLGSANAFTSQQTFNGASPFIFEGATDDTFETTIAVADPTADRTLTMPDKTGTFAIESETILNNSNHISGLILSNDTDTDHDINITAGYANDSTNTYSMNLASEITKQIDATWAAGDDAGGLFSGSVAVDTWYHVFLIRKDSDGSIDCGFDTSVTAANIPTGYTAYKWIGAALTDGSANITPFVHDGDRFTFTDVQPSISAVAQSTSAVSRTLSTPLDIRTKASLILSYRDSVIAGGRVYISDLSKTDETITTSVASMRADTNSTNSNSHIEVLTNTSSQVRSKSSSTNGILSLYVTGWEVDRGSV